MADYESGQAERELNEVRTHLHSWYAQRNIYFRRIQSVRRREMIAAERLMEKLVGDVQPEHVLRLTVGSGSIAAFNFSNRRIRDETSLAAGEELELSATGYAEDPRTVGQESRLFVGGIVRLMLGDIAKTLEPPEAGTLEIVRFRPATASIAAA